MDMKEKTEKALQDFIENWDDVIPLDSTGHLLLPFCAECGFEDGCSCVNGGDKEGV